MSNTGNTQQIIDYGAAANDGQGDPLREAFIKTDENFANIWAAGPVGSNIRITNNTVQNDATNGNIILKPNGIGVVQANAHILPNIDDLRNLGSADLRWRQLYLGTGGLDVAGTISANYVTITGDLTVAGNVTIEGNVIEIGNITSDSLQIQLANAAVTDAAADTAGLVIGADRDIAQLIYDAGNNVWTTNIGLSVGGPITGTSINVSDATIYGNLNGLDADFTGNITANYFLGNGSLLTGITTYANANAVAYGESGWAGNIRPGANNYYNLGDASAQWRGVYTGNISGQQIALSATGNTGAAWTFQNLTDSNGELYFPSGLLWQSDNDTNADYIKGNAAGIIAIEAYHANTSISSALHLEPFQAFIETTGATDYRWIFDDYGNLTAPGNIVPNTANAYSLGNSTNRWANVFVGNVTAGNLLAGGLISATGSITGSNVLTSGIVSATGNVTGGNITTAGQVSATGAMNASTITLSGSGTAVSAASGNILTNKVTGTQFAFLNGIYTATLTGSGATSNYSLALPANAGSSGQVLTTDGTGSLSWRTPAASFGGQIALTGVLTPAALTTNTNNWNPAGLATCNFLRASATVNVSLTGIAAPSPAANQLIFVVNLGPGNINILRNNAGSSPGNQFINNNDVLLNPNEAVVMMYDATSLGWRIFGIQN